MAMDPKCTAAVRAAAAGRQVSDAKMALIEDALRDKGQQLAKEDRQRWLSLTREQRTAEVARAAMEDLEAAAARKEELAGMQVAATARVDEQVKAAMLLNNLTRSQGVIRHLEQTHNQVAAIRNEGIAGLGDMIDAAESRAGTSLGRNLAMRIFDVDNPEMTRAVVREVFKNADGSTGNAAAKAGARAWLDTIERLRLRFNAAGGNVGKLGYGYLSQAHDAARIRDAGAERWAQETLPLLDRRQYVNADGTLMTNDQVTGLLRSSFETLVSGGDNKVEPGQFKSAGARANRGSDHRVLHFADGDAWMAYMQRFGEGSLYDAMVGHVGKMARDIGLVEAYGPNPAQQFQLQADLARRADVTGGAGDFLNARSAGNTPEAYWNLVSGATGMPENRFLARAGMNARNVETAAKLGGAVLTSMTDAATIASTLHFNRLPMFDFVRNLGKQLDSDHRDFLRAHGVIGESLTSTLNRWTGDNLTHSLSGRVAGAVMKLSLMNAWSDGLRGAFSTTMMGGLARMARKGWSELDEWDRYLLQRKGIDEADWSIISKATPTEHQGGQYLTADSVRGVSDADVHAAAPDNMNAIRETVKARTQELSNRNVQEAGWIKGRIDKFDDARDALNRAVKARQSKRLVNNEKATAPMLERMALLDAQRERAQLQSDMEADFNRFSTQDEVRTFLNAVEDGASADKTDVGGAKPALRQGLESAEAIGRRYGVEKGRLERRMVEIQNRVSDMDRDAGRQANKDAKAAQRKADEMAADLAEFVKRSQDRQAARRHVIDRLTSSEAPRLAAEAQRLRQQASEKVLAFVLDEAQFAVINPDLATRAIATGGGQPAGSVRGEAFRSFAQFKSFPIAMMTRHWRRILETPQGLEGAPAGFGADSKAGGVANRTAVFAMLAVTSQLLGAMVLQTKALQGGKDPYDMTTAKFWLRALAQGGGFGYLGDLVFKDPTEQRGGSVEQTAGSVMGPLVGAAAGLIGDLGVVNAWEAAKGEKTHAGAEALRWAVSNTPGASLWWTRPAFEHWFLHNAQEMMNPGYLARVKQRAQKDWGQAYWWEPGETAPERAPDLTAVGGR